MPPLIALAASLVLCAQNVGAVTAFGWALIHGAGVSALIAFVPVAVGLATLWSGYHVISRRAPRYSTALFTAFALALLAVNEAVLPATPLKVWRGQRALKGVRVLSVRDEPLLSARGNPIGVRVTFEAVVPRTTGYLLSAGLTNASPETIWPLGFGFLGDQTVHPLPADNPESIYDVFEKDVVYRFTQDMVPNFIRYDVRTRTACLAEVRTKYISETDFLAALATNRDARLNAYISVNGEYNAVNVYAGEYPISRGYDLQAIYETVANEGGGRCPQ
jgi:hypothetical protein